MASVTAAPTTSGTPSMTKAKQPAASRDLAASSERVGCGDVAGLDLEAAHGQDRLRGEAEMAHDGDLGPDDGLDDRQPGPPTLELHRLGAGPDQFRRIADGLVRREVVAHPRHVPDDQAPRVGGRHRLDVMHHHIGVDVQRVLMTQDGVGDRVTDQDQVYAGVGHDPRPRLVVGRHHDDRDRPGPPLATAQRGHRHRTLPCFAHRTGPLTGPPCGGRFIGPPCGGRFIGPPCGGRAPWARRLDTSSSDGAMRTPGTLPPRNRAPARGGGTAQ